MAHEQLHTNDNALTTWLHAIPYEVAYWQAALRNKKSRASMMSWSLYNSPLQLEGWDVQKWLATREKPTILDVGCGLSYATGNLTSDNQPLDIHYVDALAPYYNKLVEQFIPDMPRIELGMMDYLGAFYPDHDVDLIIVQNALDHSSNPMKAVWECLSALRNGGVLYLNHHPNEAEYEKYRGFHKFNIVNEKDDMLIWNQQSRFSLLNELKKVALVETAEVNSHQIAVITKVTDIPQNQLHRDEDLQRVLNAMIDYTADANDPKKARQARRTFRFYQLAQNCSKWFSVKTRQKLKKLIK